MISVRFVLLPLCLLVLFGCVRRDHRADPAVDNPTAHPIAAENHAIAQVSAEAVVERRICFALGLLSLVAMFILRGLIPGFAWIGGACAAACAGGYVWSLFVTFAAPLLMWVILAVIVVGGLATLWHFRKWILAP